jgi:putative addiction module component (TIGR02574 family)
VAVALEKILQEALALGDEDREKLLEALQRSFEPDDGETLSQEEWDAAWGPEIRARVDAFEAGAKTYSHEEVMAHLRASLNSR